MIAGYLEHSNFFVFFDLILSKQYKAMKKLYKLYTTSDVLAHHRDDRACQHNCCSTLGIRSHGLSRKPRRKTLVEVNDQSQQWWK